jgi:hypothetical protein
MNWEAIGAVGETVGAVAVVVTLIYLAVQIRQSNSQQRREEIVSVQTGQNKLVSQLMEPRVIRALAIMADSQPSAGVADRATAIFYTVQAINHFEIVYDLYHNGSLDEERYQHWEGMFVSVVAIRGVRAWWEEGSGRLCFTAKVRNVIDQKLNDTENPPIPFGAMWEVLSAESWKGVDLHDVVPDTRI